MKKSRLYGGVALFVLVFLLNCGCGPTQHQSKTMYFNGDVVVEYLQQTESGTLDYVTFRFYKVGNYKVTFSLKKSGRMNKLPQNFTLAVNNAPREYVVTQKVLTDFLTITIEKDELKESHDFS